MTQKSLRIQCAGFLYFLFFAMRGLFNRLPYEGSERGCDRTSVSAVYADENKIKSVNQCPDDNKQAAGDHNIRKGMLFDQHGRKDDQKSLNSNGCTPEKDDRSTEGITFICPPIPVQGGGNNCQAVENMDARGQVGWRIRKVKHADRTRKNVVSGHCLGAQHVDIRKNYGYSDKDRHADHKAGTQPVI